jgi:hypothetical protein
VQLVIVFRKLNVEVLDPTEFTVDVPLFWNFRIVRDSCPFYFILFIGVQLALRSYQDQIFVLCRFVKILLQLKLDKFELTL